MCSRLRTRDGLGAEAGTRGRPVWLAPNATTFREPTRRQALLNSKGLFYLDLAVG